VRFEAQVFGDALDDLGQVPRRGIAIVIKHPMKGFFAQAGLPRQFFETNVSVDEVTGHRKALGGFTFKDCIDRFHIKSPAQISDLVLSAR
jgi:hypothetical protein